MDIKAKIRILQSNKKIFTMRLFTSFVLVAAFSAISFGQATPQTDFTKQLLGVMELGDEQIAMLDKIELGHQTMLSRAVTDYEEKAARNEAIRDINSNKEIMIADVLSEKQYKTYKEHMKNQKEMRKEKEANRLKSVRALNAEDMKDTKEEKQR